ncbi:MAG: hypothetical protein WC654_07795 [Patescibacteria group bacterium]
MRTLAQNDPNRDKLLVEELRTAGIDVIFDGDKNMLRGELGNWKFFRMPERWKAFVSDPSKGLPDDAPALFISVWGDSDSASFTKYGSVFYLYTQEALTAFAHLIKAFAKE